MRLKERFASLFFVSYQIKFYLPAYNDIIYVKNRALLL